MKIRCAAALVCAVTLVSVSAWADDKPVAGEKSSPVTATATASEQKAPAVAAPPEKGPVPVEVGTYINQILAMDLKGNQFTADFYIWFRWKGDLKPFDTFDLANGRITSRTGIVKKDLGGGVHYASARILATITKFWDLRRYPLDDHHLTLEIEDNENEDNLLVYVPDTINSAASPTVEVPGWLVKGTSASVTTHEYATNYGDTSVPKGNATSYSRFVSTVEIRRPGHVGRIFKVFFTIFVATIISGWPSGSVPRKRGRASVSAWAPCSRRLRRLLPSMPCSPTRTPPRCRIG